MSYKEDILRAFLEFDPELVEQMKQCSHAGENHINPYHLENEIWVHSMLTYNQANNDDWESLIMALCHDIGKVYTRLVTAKGRISFYGHAEASIQKTIDFVHYLYKNNIIDISQLLEFIDEGLVAMANHTLLYQNIHKAHYISNGNHSILNKLEKMSKMDTVGSICKSGKIDINVKFKPFVANPINEETPTVYIWSGLPGSGKDYLAAKNDHPIVSFDDIRVKIYKEQCNSDDDDATYKAAWEYCNDNNIDLIKLLTREARRYLNDGVSVNICNTSLTRKSRRVIVNSIGRKYNYVVNQVLVPSHIILNRNANRDSKTIPTETIKDMAKRMSICTHFEKNINKIRYIYNDWEKNSLL